MKKKIKPFLIMTALAVLAVLLPASEGQSASGLAAFDSGHGIPALVIRITDGDTIVCRVGGRKERVRLIGVDAPEMHRNEKFERDIARDRRHAPREVLALGRRARDFVTRAVPPGSVVWLELDVQERDRYGRLLAYVWYPGPERQVMLNALLVSAGLAKVMTVPPDVKYAELFYRLQRKARKERKGFWAK